VARYTGPVCRLCRRAGEKLMLKGMRCLTPKCALERRHLALGPRRGGRRRPSEYALRLREKQKVRRMYGMLERSFRRCFAQAQRSPGLSGENLLRLLEMRLDNVVYRLGFADSRRQARQLVRHRHFVINGVRTDIPSYQMKVGDTIGWRESSTKLEPYKRVAEEIESKVIPGWLKLDPATLTGKVVSAPAREDIDATINERLIVEYYSR